MDPLVAHERAQDAFARVLSQVGDDQLDAETPCSEWRVRDLVGHVIAGNQRMAGIAASPTPDSAAALIGAHADSAQAAQLAFSAPDGMTRPFETRSGSLPGSVVIGMRTADVVTHAWDLARATGQPTDIDEELAEQVLAASRERMGTAPRAPGGPFGDAQPCDDARPAADRLAAFLGRAVS